MAVLRQEGVAEFFSYARERHSVYLRRSRGERPPWTDDPVIRDHRFTNVFRELDRTTVWCRENVRRRYDHRSEVLPAIVLFRWFNKIETGEAMFAKAPGVLSDCSPFDHWVRGGHDGVAVLRRAVIRHVGEAGPFTNAAYIVKSPDGMSKLDGVLMAAERFRTARPCGHGWLEAASAMRSEDWTLEIAWTWVREHSFQGDFTAYEVVTDLRHTYLLKNAPDIMTWANAGPGAVRGLNRVQGRPVVGGLPKKTSLEEMRGLLQESRSIRHWPNSGKDWPRWEMRDVEHTLCEYDKWVRVRLGEGRAKQRYTAK